MMAEPGQREAVGAPPLRIAPDSSSTSLQEFWRYRDLLYFLVRRDISLRYKQTLLGIVWALLQPLLTMLVLALLLGRWGGIRTGAMPYSIFLFLGLVPWTYFANAVASSGTSLIASSSLVSKVYFPRMVIPAAAVVAGLVDVAVSLPILGGLMAYHRISPGLGIVALPAFLVLTAVTALAVGLGFCALNVKYRDFRHVLPFTLQLAFFATPVIYPATLFPPRWRWALLLNPMAGTLEGVRASALGTPLDPELTAAALLGSGLLLVASLRLFARMEKGFADYI